MSWCYICKKCYNNLRKSEQNELGWCDVDDNDESKCDMKDCNNKADLEIYWGLDDLLTDRATKSSKYIPLEDL